MFGWLKRRSAPEVETRASGAGYTAALMAAPAWRPVINPADHRDVVGQVREATLADVERALALYRTSCILLFGGILCLAAGALALLNAAVAVLWTSGS